MREDRENEIYIQAEEVKLMKNSEGWKIVSGWMHKQQETAAEKLLTIDPTDSMGIAKQQATIKAYSQLELKIKEYIKIKRPGA